MKTIKVTLKFEFESEEVDNESLKEALALVIEERIANDELLEGAKINITDDGEGEEFEPEFEDDEDDL